MHCFCKVKVTFIQTDNNYSLVYWPKGFPGGSKGKESTCNTGDLGLTPGLGRYPGEGNGYPLQYSCLKNSMDRGAWRATVHGSQESDTTERLTLFFIAVVLCLVAQSCPTFLHTPFWTNCLLLFLIFIIFSRTNFLFFLVLSITHSISL